MNEELTAVEKLYLRAQLEESIEKHFYFKSLLWRAVQAHVYGDHNVLVDHPVGYNIASHRGTGPAISLRRVRRLPKAVVNGVLEDPREIQFAIEVTYYSKEDEYQEYPAEHVRKYDIVCPQFLETDFDQVKFDAYLAGQAKVARERRVKQAKNTVIAALRECPEYASEILVEVARMDLTEDEN